MFCIAQVLDKILAQCRAYKKEIADPGLCRSELMEIFYEPSFVKQLIDS